MDEQHLMRNAGSDEQEMDGDMEMQMDEEFDEMDMDADAMYDAYGGETGDNEMMEEAEFIQEMDPICEEEEDQVAGTTGAANDTIGIRAGQTRQGQRS